jgi:hypothetical protein
MSVSAAKSRVMQAQTLIESRRYDEVEAVIDTGMSFLVGLPEEETAVVAAELAGLRAAAAEAAVGEQAGQQVRAAERELRYARENLDAGNVMPAGIEDQLRKAEQYLAGVPERYTAELIGQLAGLRARLAGAAPPPAAAPGAAPQPQPPANEDEARVLSRARSAILGCRSAVESGRTEGVAEELTSIAGTLSGFSGERAAALRAEIDEIRTAALSAESAEDIRRVTGELDRHYSRAESAQAWEAEAAERSLRHLTERLRDGDVRRALPPDTLRRYEDRLVSARAGLVQVLKDDALERALPLLAQIEDRLATDPYDGLTQDEGFAVTSDLANLKERVLRSLDRAAADDPDVVAIHDRLRAADERIEAASAALAIRRLEANVADRWRMTESEFAGWRDETYDGPARAGDVPNLPLTRLAIMRVGYLLRDPETQQTRTDHAGNPAIQAVFQAVDETFEAAGAKLRAAYDRVIDHADAEPSPAVEADVSRLSHLATAAETSFEHTPHRAPVLARISEVEERWQAEYAALLRARQELYDRLAVEADAAWPGIVAATGAIDGFDPADPADVGATVLLTGVRNRSGWDFTGADFSMRLNGMPVGGSYESYVLKALEHAWYELKLDVNDRITWDVVGVVTGPAKLGQRTNRTLRDQDGREIGKIEEWPLVDSVHLRIVALHAGPVAVGPTPDSAD